MKILLAEADGALAGRLFHLLVKNGYQTTAVKTGQAALDCLIKPVDDNELLLRIPALQRRTQTGGERCRNLSFLSSTTLDPKRASAAVYSDCRACACEKTYAQVQKEQSSRGARGGKARLESDLLCVCKKSRRQIFCRRLCY